MGTVGYVAPILIVVEWLCKCCFCSCGCGIVILCAVMHRDETTDAAAPVVVVPPQKYLFGAMGTVLVVAELMMVILCGPCCGDAVGRNLPSTPTNSLRLLLFADHRFPCLCVIP